MTQRQVMGFYTALDRRDRAARADRVEDVGMGFGGGKKVAEFIKALRKR